MNIYQKTYSPFFYIIQDTLNGIYYAGSKWAVNASPETFMTNSGYKTSSKIVKSLIKEHGLGRFIIRKIRKFNNEKDTRIYETRFLRRVNAKYNPRFYNESNGDGSVNIEKAKETWMGKYGTDSPLKSNIIHDKIKETNMIKYGVERPLSSPEIREKSKETNRKRYGVDSVLESPEIRQKITETNLSKYGVGNPMNNSEIQHKMKETMVERYGVDNPSKCPEIASKISLSLTKHYKNNDHHMIGKNLSNETKQKLREANLGKTHTEETKRKMSETRSEKVWIKKEGEKSKHIQLHEVEKYLGSGWEFGRHLKPQTKKRNKYTEDQKKALSDKLSNRIWIKKDGESSKHIDATDFEIYSTMGWSRGRGNNGKGRKS